jgi:hypothetical protein
MILDFPAFKFSNPYDIVSILAGRSIKCSLAKLSLVLLIYSVCGANKADIGLELSSYYLSLGLSFNRVNLLVTESLE